MNHPLVDQLHFARAELQRCLASITDEDARRRFRPMNCLSWIVGHLANQEDRYWVLMAQEKQLAPGLNDLVGYGKPASTPRLDEMWQTWHVVTHAADEYLESLKAGDLDRFLEWKGKPARESVGTMLQRNIYHYWFHTGEAHAIRQLLGHSNLPDFVGDMSKAQYRPPDAV
jgi:hypothetical protein